MGKWESTVNWNTEDLSSLGIWGGGEAGGCTALPRPDRSLDEFKFTKSFFCSLLGSEAIQLQPWDWVREGCDFWPA